MQEILQMLENKLSYKVRLEGLELIKEYDLNEDENKKLRYKVIDLALNDRVFRVKQSAFLLCQRNKLKRDGEVISLGKKNTGYSPNDIRKMFIKIRRELEMKELDLELFKAHFLKIAPQMYDVMESDHLYFDNWIRGIYKYISNN